MMIILKTSRELAIMREAGRISAMALKLAGAAVEPGVSTWEIDRVARRYIEEQGAKPSFLGYGGFLASACVSVNNVVIHGIPSKSRILKAGDIVSIDIGAMYEGRSPRKRRGCWMRPVKACLRELPRQKPATGSVISAARCSGMSKRAVTRWYGILSATE
jgi:hypothetical protein